MVKTSEQFLPLPPTANRHNSSDEECAANGKRRRRWLRCCVCVGVVVLILAVTLVIIIFTVLKERDPFIIMNGVRVDRLDLINGTNIPRPGSNASLTADVSVRNRNYPYFWYRNTTSAIFYRGVEVGESYSPSGRARGRRTIRMNVSVEVITDRVMSVPELRSDIKSGMVTVNILSEVGGKVKLLLIKKHVRMKMNCNLSVNITSRAIQTQKCKFKVKL